MPRKKIPNELTNLIGTSLDSNDANIVLNEVKEVLNLEYQLPPLVDNGLTYGDWGMFSVDKKTANDYRPNSALSIEIIEQMLKSAPVRFALEMKRAQIVSVFRNERSWKIECADEELRDVVTYNLQKILPKMALDFSFSSLAYGVSFQELVWERKSKFELGLEEEQTSDVKFIVAKVPNSINPATVDRIKRTLDGHFDGFVQKPRWIMGDKEIVIPKEASLIIPYEEKFRNLWGESILKPMYPIWYWYEIVLRAMVKYMERTGTPVAMVKAPARASILDPNTKKRYDGITWGMQIASNVARTNAIVIPSDKDEQGNPLWELSYLNSSERSQPFLDILELLTQMILRAGLSADRALSQSSGGVGSYSIGEIHKEATALHNELILTQWIHYLNTYFLPLYSLYNRGQSGPTVMIETQGLDPTDRTNLTTLLGVSQNMQSFQEVGNRIDWVSLLSVNNIPLLSQEEADEKKKKLEEESLKKQENMLDMQSKFSSPSPTKTEEGGLKANAGNKPAEKKSEDSKKLEGGLEDTIDLANSYHDNLGRFATSSGKKAAAIGFAGSGIPGAAVGAGLNKLAGVETVRAGKIGGTVGGLITGGLLGAGTGFAGSKITESMVNNGNGWFVSVGTGYAASLALQLAVGSALVYGTGVTAKLILDAVSNYEGKSEDTTSKLELDAANMLFAKYPGQDDPKFKNGIAKLNSNMEDKSAQKDVAESLGMDVNELKRQLELVKFYKSNQLVKPADLPADNPNWGSRNQLMSGKIVADNLDSNLNGSVAVLLSPTMGIAGSRDYDLSGLADAVGINRRVLDLHTSTHDAAGYLYNAHGIGPGYNYSGGLLYKGLPVSGQYEGYQFWESTLKRLETENNAVASLEEQINLFNPYHDELGQFAETKGSPSKAMIASSKWYAEKKASGSLLGSIVKTTGLVLGIGTAGIVGLTVLGASTAKAQEVPQEADLQNRLADVESKLDELSKNWPKFNNEQEATAYMVKQLNELGIADIPNNVNVVVGYGKGVGEYQATTNTLMIDPSLVDDVKNGTPSAMLVIAHELAHSDQEFVGNDPAWGNGDEMVDVGIAPHNDPLFRDMLEGQNDLTALLAVKQIYNKGMTQEEIAKVTSSYKSLSAEKNILSSMIEDNTNDSGVKIVGMTSSNNTQMSEMPLIGYPEETKTWARLAIIGSEKTGVSAKEYLLNAHKYGFSQNESHQVLVDLFPEEMETKGYYVPPSKGIFGIGASKAQRKWPSQSEINSWMDTHGYISKDKALEQMLNEVVE